MKNSSLKSDRHVSDAVLIVVMGLCVMAFLNVAVWLSESDVPRQVSFEDVHKIRDPLLALSEDNNNELFVGDDAAFSILLKNTGSEVLSIEDVRTSCSCVQTTVSDRTVENGGSVSLQGILRSPADAGVVEQVVELEIAGSKSGTRERQRIPVKKRFLSNLNVEVHVRNSSESPIANHTDSVIEVTNLTSHELSVSVSEESLHGIQFTPSAFVVQPKGMQSVAWHSPPNSGVVAAARINVNQGREIRLIPLSLQVPGSAVPIPRVLILGVISEESAGHRYSVDVSGTILQNNTISVVSLPDALQVETVDRTSPMSHRFDFTLRAANSQNNRLTGTIEFHVISDSGSVLQMLRIPVVGVRK